ncbi:MAG: hypothetical protein HOA17_09000 [Candidatus Melainabacteria bacterium]|jgi:uridine kinase|nr:hypothetical protein [Candidatus Melainabacteria bacterium]
MKKIFYDRFGNIKVEGLDSPVFFVGLVVKLVLAFFLASNFLSGLFLPFVNFFVDSFPANPYQYFYELGKMDVFPYPALMLWILSLPKLVVSTLLGTSKFSINFDLLLLRIPLLLADLAILMVLLRWLKNQTKQVLYLYWLSPILIYINYMHGQLDVIPIAFLFLSLHLLFKEKFYLSLALLAAAILCKTHIFIVLPFYFFYIWKSRTDCVSKLKYLAAGLVTHTGLFFLINSPYLMSEGFNMIVFHNDQQAKIFSSLIHFPQDLSFYIIPAIYLILILNSLNYKSYSREIFVMFLGFSFGILTVFIPPMQGWYYWTVPFLIYFYIRQQEAPLYNFVLLNFCYFGYFALIPGSDFLLLNQLGANGSSLFQILLDHGYDAKLALNLAFTLLQTSIMINCLWIYTKGIKSNLNYKIKNKPLLVGIGGNSGAGKTTFSNLLEKVFAKKNTTVIRGDDMHKYERGDPMWKIYTHLNPKANKLHEDIKHAQMLKEGGSIKRRHYDHADGRFTIPKAVQANRIIIFEGLHPFYLPAMRRLYDFKVFMKPEQQLALKWKVTRDQEERGHSEEKVKEQIKERKEDSSMFIEVQEKHADLVVSYGATETGQALILEFNSDIDFEACFNQLTDQQDLEIQHYYQEEKQFLRFEGKVAQTKIEQIAYDLLPELEDIILAEPEWEADDRGLLQLFAVYSIFKRMEIEAAKG